MRPVLVWRNRVLSKQNEHNTPRPSTQLLAALVWQFVLNLCNTSVSISVLAIGQVCMGSKLRVLSRYSRICVQHVFPCHYYHLPVCQHATRTSSSLNHTKEETSIFLLILLKKPTGKIKFKMQPTGCMTTLCMDCLKGSNACKIASLQKYLPRKITELQKYLPSLCYSELRKTIAKTGFLRCRRPLKLRPSSVLQNK